MPATALTAAVAFPKTGKRGVPQQFPAQAPMQQIGTMAPMQQQLVGMPAQQPMMNLQPNMGVMTGFPIGVPTPMGMVTPRQRNNGGKGDRNLVQVNECMQAVQGCMNAMATQRHMASQQQQQQLAAQAAEQEAEKKKKKKEAADLTANILTTVQAG